MTGHDLWSFAPYRPPLADCGGIYICRVAPGSGRIRLEWLGAGEREYAVYFRERGKGSFIRAGSTGLTSFDIEGLAENVCYEFYVCGGRKRSLTRLAVCGRPCGTVVNYLHPEDGAYAFSGSCLCSPSLLVHPDGYYLASMDVYEAGAPQDLTLIFRSDDRGRSWRYVSELMPCFWGKLFLHGGRVYMLACSTEYGDLLIGRSEDGGRTFCAPAALLRGSGGKRGCPGVHKNPQPAVAHSGRIWSTLEWGNWSYGENCHCAMVMSFGEDDDPMDPGSWRFSEPLKYDPSWRGTAPDGKAGMLEGALCVAPDGGLRSYMRYQTDQKKILSFRVRTDGPDLPLEYLGAVDFPGNLSKFMIKYDEPSGRYYSVVCRRIDAPATNRNLLSLITSKDLAVWETAADLIDRRNDDPDKVGFQYADFEFDGDDLIYLCRTAMNGARSFHDSNYCTFHRLKNFRDV